MEIGNEVDLPRDKLGNLTDKHGNQLKDVLGNNMKNPNGAYFDPNGHIKDKNGNLLATYPGDILRDDSGKLVDSNKQPRDQNGNLRDN
jgi:hypothetical protein